MNKNKVKNEFFFKKMIILKNIKNYLKFFSTFL